MNVVRWLVSVFNYIFTPRSAPRTASQEFASGLSDTEHARVRDTAAYMARRDLFTAGLEMERSEVISRKETMRESAERISLNKRVSGGVLCHRLLRWNRYLVFITLYHRTAFKGSYWRFCFCLVFPAFTITSQLMILDMKSQAFLTSVITYC